MSKKVKETNQKIFIYFMCRKKNALIMDLFGMYILFFSTTRKYGFRERLSLEWNGKLWLEGHKVRLHYLKGHNDTVTYCILLGYYKQVNTPFTPRE